MLKRNTKRIFAMLLAFALVLGSVLVPSNAYAADPEIPAISGIGVSKDAITNANRKVEVTVTGTALPETLYYRLYKDGVRTVDNTAITSQGTDTTRTFVVEIPENTSGQDEKWKVWVNYVNLPNGWTKSSEITLSATGGSETPDPEEPDTFDTKVLKVKVVDEAGNAVAGVPLYLESANFAGRGDVAFEKVTDTNGQASYTCDSNDMLDDTFYLKTTSDSGYTCEPIEVYVEENDDGDLAVSEIDGKAYTGEVTLTVAKEAAKVDKSKLEAAINAYVDKDACTAASYQVYAAALAEAKAVNENENATQEEVDAATSKLTKARAALVYLDLQATIDKNELPRKGGTATITANGVLDEKVWWVLQVGKSNSMGLTYTTVGNEVNETAVSDGKATIAVEIPENTTGEEVTYRVRVSASEPKIYGGSYSWSSPKSFMIKVAAKDVEIVDKTLLAAAIEKEENSYKNEGAYLSSTWEAYKTALAAAKEVNAKADATQDEVDTALRNMNQAVNGLTFISLTKVTVTPESLTSAGGTVTVKAEGILNAKVWWKLEKKSAEGYYEQEGAAVNEAVLSADKTFTIEIPENTAETAAEYRIQVKESEPSPWMWGVTQKATFTVAAKEREAVNKTDLNYQIDFSKNFEGKQSEYTADSYKKFEDALAKAREVSANEDATQDEVNAATQALKDAREALEKLPLCNATEIRIAIVNEAGEKVTESIPVKIGTSKQNITKGLISYDVSTADTGLSEIVVSLNGDSVTINGKEYEFSPASHTFTLKEYAGDITVSAIDGTPLEGSREVKFVLKEKQAAPVDKVALTAKIAEAKAIASEEYTAESYEALQTAIAEAEAVEAKAEATQEEVDATVAALQTAIEGLEKKPVDPEPVVPTTDKLKAAIAKAKAVDSAKYTTESYAAVTDALKKAEEVLNNANATQEDIDTAESSLLAAIDGLKVKEETPSKDPQKPSDDKKTDDKKTDDKKAGTSDKKSNSPQTGDAANALPFAMAAVSSLMVAGVVVKKRKED